MLSITHHKNGLKMEKFLSINVALGEFCNSMRTNKDCICSQCYAYYMSCRYKRLNASLKRNADELSTRILPPDECKEIADQVNKKRNIKGLRFDSMGELINENHVYNLQNIAYMINGKIPVTLWTKRPSLLFKVLKSPAFKVIYSNPMINSFVSPSTKDDRICHTFNVYSDPVLMKWDMIKAENMGIKIALCNGSCKDCMTCYNEEHNDRRAIFELTKKAQGKTGGI